MPTMRCIQIGFAILTYQDEINFLCTNSHFCFIFVVFFSKNNVRTEKEREKETTCKREKVVNILR